MDPLVLAQAPVKDIYQPGREAISALEAGQGLRARSDALQRQKVLQGRDDADYMREQRIRELMASGKPEEAKGLMTLQERSQLVNIQGAMLNQKIAGIELDMKEKALNDAYGFIDRASKLDPNKDTFDREAASLATEAAPVAVLNPEVGNALGATLEAKKQERNTLLKKVSDEYLRDFNAIMAEDIPANEKIAKVNQWQAENPEAFQGPYANRIEDAVREVAREARTQSLIEASGRTSTRDTEFERSIQQGLEEGWLTPEEAVAKRKKRQDFFTTPRTTGFDPLAAVSKLLGEEPGAPAAPTGTPVVPAAAPRYTREQLIDAVRSGKLSKEEAKRIAQEQGIQ